MRILVIDSSNVWIRFWSVKTKTNVELGEKELTSLVLTSTLERIRRWVSEYRIDKTILCFDRQTSSSKRKSIYPDYKKTRGTPKDSGITRVPGMKEGISIFEKLAQFTTNFEIRVDGTREADDLPIDFINETDEYFLISADLDWFRYVNDNVTLFNFTREYKGKEVRHDKTECQPGTLVNYKMLHGDSSDDVKPIKPYVSGFIKGSLINARLQTIQDVLQVPRSSIDVLLAIYGADTDSTYLEIVQGEVDLDKANDYLTSQGLSQIVIPYRRRKDVRDLMGL